MINKEYNNEYTPNSPTKIKRKSLLPPSSPTILTQHITSLNLPAPTSPTLSHHLRKNSTALSSTSTSFQNLIFSRRFANTREILNHLYARQSIDISLLKDAFHTSNVEFLTEAVAFMLDRMAEVNHDMESYFTEVINPGSRAGELAVINWLGLNKGAQSLNSSCNYLFDLFAGFHQSSLIDFFRILRSRDNWSTGSEFRAAIHTSPLHTYRNMIEQEWISVSPARREYFLFSYVLQLTFQPVSFHDQSNPDSLSPQLKHPFGLQQSITYTDALSKYIGTDDPSVSIPSLFPDAQNASIQSHYETVCGLFQFIIAIMYSSANPLILETLFHPHAPALNPTPNTQHAEYTQIEHSNEFPWIVRSTLLNAGLSTAYGTKLGVSELIQLNIQELSNSTLLNLTTEHTNYLNQTIQSLQHEELLRSQLFNYLLSRFGPNFWSIYDIKHTYLLARAYGDQQTIDNLEQIFGITLDDFWLYNHTAYRSKRITDESYLGGLQGMFEWYNESPPTAQEFLSTKQDFYTSLLPLLARRGLTTALDWICQFEGSQKDITPLISPNINEIENIFTSFASGQVLNPQTLQWLLQQPGLQLILHSNHPIRGSTANFILQLFKSPSNVQSKVEIFNIVLQHVEENPDEYPIDEIGISLYEFCLLLRESVDIETWKSNVGLPLDLFRVLIERKLINRAEWNDIYHNHPVEFCALINCALRGGDFEQLDNPCYKGSDNLVLLSRPICSNTDNGRNHYRVDITALSNLQLQYYYNDLTELFCDLLFPMETYSYIIHIKLKLDPAQIHLASAALIEFAMTSSHVDLVKYLFELFNPIIHFQHLSSLIASSLTTNDYRNLLSFYQLPTSNNFQNLSLPDTTRLPDSIQLQQSLSSSSQHLPSLNLSKATFITLSTQHYELIMSSYGDYANFLSTLDEIDSCSQEYLSSVPEEHQLSHNRLTACPSITFKKQLFGHRPFILPGLDIESNEFNQCNEHSDVEYSYVLRSDSIQPIYSLSHFSLNDNYSLHEQPQQPQQLQQLQQPQQPQQPQQQQKQQQHQQHQQFSIIPQSLSFEPIFNIPTHPNNLHLTLLQYLTPQYITSEPFVLAFQWLCFAFEHNNSFPYFERSSFLSILELITNRFFETFNQHHPEQLDSLQNDDDDMGSLNAFNLDRTIPTSPPDPSTRLSTSSISSSTSQSPFCTTRMIRELFQLFIDQSILTLLSTNPHGIMITILAQFFPQYSTQFWSNYALTALSLQLSAQSINNIIWLDDFFNWGLVALSFACDDKSKMDQLYSEYQQYILQPYESQEQQQQKQQQKPHFSLHFPSIGPIYDYIQLRESYLLAQTQLFHHQLLDEYDDIWLREKAQCDEDANLPNIVDIYPFPRSDLRDRNEIECIINDFESNLNFSSSLVYNFPQYIKTASNPFQFGSRASNYILLECLTAILTTSTTVLPQIKLLQEEYETMLDEYHNIILPDYQSQYIPNTPFFPPNPPQFPQELERSKKLASFKPFIDHLRHLSIQLYDSTNSSSPSASSFPSILLKAFYVIFTTSSLHAIADMVDLYLSLGGELVPPIPITRQESINTNNSLSFQSRSSITSTGQDMTVTNPPPKEWLFAPFPAHFHVHMQHGEIDSHPEEYAAYYLFIVKNIHQIDIQYCRFLVGYRYKFFIQYISTLQQKLAEEEERHSQEQQRLRDAQAKERRRTQLQKQGSEPTYLDQFLESEYLLPILALGSTTIAGIVGYLFWSASPQNQNSQRSQSQ